MRAATVAAATVAAGTVPAGDFAIQLTAIVLALTLSGYFLHCYLRWLRWQRLLDRIRQERIAHEEPSRIEDAE